jgi:hypothetical protein
MDITKEEALEKITSRQYSSMEEHRVLMNIAYPDDKELFEIQKRSALEHFPPDEAEVKATMAVDYIRTGERKTQEEIIQENKPGIVKLASNFMKAVSRHVKSGAKQVDKETYEKRMSICDTCVFRQGNRCSHASCGCFLAKKASWESESCPIGRW